MIPSSNPSTSYSHDRAGSGASETDILLLLAAAVELVDVELVALIGTLVPASGANVEAEVEFAIRGGWERVVLSSVTPRVVGGFQAVARPVGDDPGAEGGGEGCGNPCKAAND